MRLRVNRRTFLGWVLVVEGSDDHRGYDRPTRWTHFNHQTSVANNSGMFAPVDDIRYAHVALRN